MSEFLVSINGHLARSLEGAVTARDLAQIEREIAQSIESASTAPRRRSMKQSVAMDNSLIDPAEHEVVLDTLTPEMSEGDGLVAAALGTGLDARWRATAAAAAPIDEALERVQATFAKALEDGGLPREVVTTLLTLVNLTADAQVAKQQIASKREHLLAANQPDAKLAHPGNVLVVPGDALEPLSAASLGERLRLHEQSVRTREREGKLFSVLRTGRKRGQEFPAFQAFTGVAGEPLERVLAALVPPGRTEPVSGPTAYGFFTSPSDLLAGLAPVEVLLGQMLSVRIVDPVVNDVLREKPEARLQLVLETAHAQAASETL